MAITFFTSGIWDAIAAILYFFVIGNGRMIDNPQVHPFYTVFLGSFFTQKHHSYFCYRKQTLTKLDPQ